MANQFNGQPAWLGDGSVRRGVKSMVGWVDLSGITANAAISVNCPYSVISPHVVEASGFRVKYTGRRRFFAGLEHSVEEQYCPELHVNTKNGKWRVDPIVGDTGAYELVLGMDWLKAHHVLIDCAHHTLVFWPPHEKPVKAVMRNLTGNKRMLVGERPQEKEEDAAIRAEMEAEPFTLSEVRNDWAYHVKNDLLRGYFGTE